MRYVFTPLTHAMWPVVVDKLGVRWTEDTRGILVYDQQAKSVIAGVVFENWTFSSVQVHQWVESSLVLRHGLYNEVVRYAFVEAGLKKLVGVVPEDNEAAIRLNKHIGFRVTHKIEDGFKPGVASVIMEANHEDLARWFPKQQEAA